MSFDLHGAADAAADELPVLWRDEHLIAVYKPSGWLVHRTGLDAAETRFVVQTLRAQLRGRHVWPLHRLDKGTCGVLLLALHAQAASAMGAVFAGAAPQRVHKRYLAFVRGWAPPCVEVDHALRPEESAPDTPPQPAQTRLACLARLEWPESSDACFATTRASLVLAEPRTGRRHQVRRHLKHIAHPIIGDANHGKGALNRWWAQRLGRQRLWLHAWGLAFAHPFTGEAVAIDSGLAWDGHCLQRSAAAGVVTGAAALDLQGWQALGGAFVRHAAASPAAAPAPDNPAQSSVAM